MSSEFKTTTARWRQKDGTVKTFTRRYPATRGENRNGFKREFQGVAIAPETTMEPQYRSLKSAVKVAFSKWRERRGIRE